MNAWKKAEARNKARVEGVKVEVVEFPGWAFWLRPADAWNKAYARAAIRVAERPEVKALLQKQDFPAYVPTSEDDAIDAAAMAATFGEGCIVKWEGVTGPDDEPLTYSADNAELLLTTFPELLSALKAVAFDETRFSALTDKEKEEAARGNSSTASNLSSGRGGKRSKP